MPVRANLRQGTFTLPQVCIHCISFLTTPIPPLLSHWWCGAEHSRSASSSFTYAISFFARADTALYTKLSELRMHMCTLSPLFFYLRRHSYSSLWNKTALLSCDGTEPAAVCVVGGGASGLHMAWLLGRRGYRPIVFEQNNRIGGKVRRGEAGCTQGSERYGKSVCARVFACVCVHDFNSPRR